MSNFSELEPSYTVSYFIRKHWMILDKLNKEGVISSIMSEWLRASLNNSHYRTFVLRNNTSEDNEKLKMCRNKLDHFLFTITDTEIIAIIEEKFRSFKESLNEEERIAFLWPSSNIAKLS